MKSKASYLSVGFLVLVVVGFGGAWTLQQSNLQSYREHLARLESKLDRFASAKQTLARSTDHEAGVRGSPIASATKSRDATDVLDGLQSPHPEVREEAADALSGGSADPVVREWLNHISQNDPDPDVRREALRALSRRND